jgi:hypothetical protein
MPEKQDPLTKLPESLRFSVSRTLAVMDVIDELRPNLETTDLMILTLAAILDFNGLCLNGLCLVEKEG